MDRRRLAWLSANWCAGNPKCFTCRITQAYHRTRRELPAALNEIRDVNEVGTTVLAILDVTAAMAGTLEHVVQLAVLMNPSANTPLWLSSSKYSAPYDSPTVKG